jgi:hypothetical protein
MVIEVMLGEVTVTVPAGTLLRNADRANELKIFGWFTVTVTELTTCLVVLSGVYLKIPMLTLDPGSPPSRPGSILITLPPGAGIAVAVAVIVGGAISVGAIVGEIATTGVLVAVGPGVSVDAAVAVAVGSEVLVAVVVATGVGVAVAV